MAGIKAVILYNPRTKETIDFITDADEVPPLIEPKVEPQKRRGRPRKEPKPEVS